MNITQLSFDLIRSSNDSEAFLVLPLDDPLLFDLFDLCDAFLGLLMMKLYLDMIS